MAAEETQNQPLEQARDSVLRHGEWVGRELLNFVVLDAGIRLGMKPGLAFTWVRTPGEVITDPLRGEVWLVDLGMDRKDPALLDFSVRAAGSNDRVPATVVTRTTSARGSEFEVAVSPRFLKAGVFDAQNIISTPDAKIGAPPGRTDT